MHKYATGERGTWPKIPSLPPLPEKMVSEDNGLSCSKQGLLQHLYKHSHNARMVSFSARSHQPFGILERQSSMFHTWLDVSFTHICMQREAGPSLYFTFTHSTVHKLSPM